MTRTMKELADFLGCHYEGDGAVRVSGVASTVSAHAEDLIYVESPRHLGRAAASASKCVVIAPGLSLNGKVLLRAEKPKLAFARAAEWLLPAEPIAKGIHSSAIIAESARIAAGVSVGPYAVIEDDVHIGAGTEIGAFCFIGSNSIIGEACRFYPRVTLYAGSRIENRVILHSGAVIGSDGFGYVSENGKYRKFPQIGEVEIGDDVEIGANTTIDRGSLDRTIIGSGVKLDNLVHIAHNVNYRRKHSNCGSNWNFGLLGYRKRRHYGRPSRYSRSLRSKRWSCQSGRKLVSRPGKIIRGGGVVWGTPCSTIRKI